MMKKSALGTSVFSVQWFVFLIANSLMFPILIGKIYNLSPDEILSMVQRTFFVVGIASVIAVWMGHRLLIIDGPAGIWLGIFVIMGQIASAQGSDPHDTLRLLEGGMMLSGALVIAIAFAGWMQKMLKILTPLVTGVYLILLTFQLSGTFLKGMIGSTGTSDIIQPLNVLIAFATFVLILVCSIWGRGAIKSYAILIGVIFGWVAYTLANGTEHVQNIGSAFSLPALFAWGTPTLNSGMIATSFLVAFILISNVIASVSAMQTVVGENTGEEGRRTRIERGGIAAGISNILTSLFSAIGMVPLSISAGFVQITGQRSKRPYYIACFALILVSFLPGLYSLLALLPAQVAYAAMFGSFYQMIGIGLVSILKVPLDERRLAIIGLALTIGTGVMFLPQNLFSTLPTIFQYLAGNGIMVGMLVAVLVEQCWRVKAKESGAAA